MNVRPSISSNPPASRAQRLLAWLCALVLVLQMLGAMLHRHDLAVEHVSDCVSCQLASHYPGDLPAAGPVLLAALLLVAYVLARRPVYASPRLPSYLIPARQAPPHALSSLS